MKRLAARVVAVALAVMGPVVGLTAFAPAAHAAVNCQPGINLPPWLGGTPILTNMSFTVVRGGNTFTYAVLKNNIQNGDVVTAHFDIDARVTQMSIWQDQGCTAMDLTLASYKAIYTTFSQGNRTTQTLFDSAYGSFLPGSTGNTLGPVTVPAGTSGASINIGPQSMEGAFIATPGTWLSVGYIFKYSWHHPASTVSFVNPKVTFNVACKADNTPVSFTVPMPNATYDVAANDTITHPTTSDRVAASYQGSMLIPDVCAGHGSLIKMDKGGTFTATVFATDTTDRISVQWHYRNPYGKGQGSNVVPGTNCADGISAYPVGNPGSGYWACSAPWSWTGCQHNVPTAPPFFQVDFAEGPTVTDPSTQGPYQFVPSGTYYGG